MSLIGFIVYFGFMAILLSVFKDSIWLVVYILLHSLLIAHFSRFLS